MAASVDALLAAHSSGQKEADVHTEVRHYDGAGGMFVTFERGVKFGGVKVGHQG